jgi:O-antigen/teichoic acid export membrane protein
MALSLSDDLMIVISALGLSILISFFIKIWSLLRFMQNSNMPMTFTNKNYPATFMTYVFSTHFSNIINLANEKNLGVLLVGYIVGPFYAGLFKAARSIVKILRRIMDPLLDIVFPEFVNLVNEGRLNDLIRLISKSTKILGLISLAVGAVLFVLSEEIITLFFGIKYIAAHTALSLLVIASLINNISYWITPAILALGKPRYLLIISSFVSVIYIATLYPLVINFNHDGAALSGLLRAFSVFLVGIVLFRIALKKKIT